MRNKTFGIRGFKATDDARGEFEAVVAVFGNVDLAGDRIVKGAFTASLKSWKDRGRPIPVIFSHDWNNLDAHIGHVLEAKETSEGLWVRAQLDMDDPSAAKVWRLMKRGSIAEFSFAYEVVEEKLRNGANELLQLDIIEVGPTLKGMNPATRLVGVKANATGLAAASGDGRKQAVSGSFEERRELVGAAIRGRYSDLDRYWVHIMATYEDRVIVALHGEQETSYREIAYMLTAGTCELGEERDVVLQTTVMPKSMFSPASVREQIAALSTDGKRRGPAAGVLATKAAIELMELGIDEPVTASSVARELLAAGF